MTFSQIGIAPETSILFITLLMTFAVGFGQASNHENELLTLENERYQAMVRTDLRFLDSILDEDLIFTHASGKIDSKSSLIESLSKGTLIYNQIEIHHPRVRRYGACGVVTGESLLDITVQGENRKLQLQFTTVWIEDQGRWKVVAYQSTHIPAGN